MRIVSKPCFSPSLRTKFCRNLGIFSLVFVTLADARAQTPPMPAMPAVSPPPTAAPMLSASIASSGSPASSLPALTPPLVPAAVPGTSNTLTQTQTVKIDAGAAEIGKSISTMEDQSVSNAKSIVKQMDSSSTAITLEDLNVARQAVVRLDAMIEVEKHLAELDKMRSERNGDSGHVLANAIPASALLPPPMQGNMPMLTRAPEPVKVSLPPPVPKFSDSTEVTRISGTDGVYAALLTMNDGSTKVVKAGDHLSGNGTVRSISSTSVILDVNGTTHNLRVKNIDAIYNAMR